VRPLSDAHRILFYRICNEIFLLARRHMFDGITLKLWLTDSFWRGRVFNVEKIRSNWIISNWKRSKHILEHNLYQMFQDCISLERFLCRKKIRSKPILKQFFLTLLKLHSFLMSKLKRYKYILVQICLTLFNWASFLMSKPMISKPKTIEQISGHFLLTL
jgi:hypothetical protein